MASSTPNYGFIQPAVGNPIDQDIWGDQLNSNWGSLDGLLKTATDFTTAATETSLNVAITSANLNQLVPLDATSNNITVDLPAAAIVGNGFVVGFKRIDSSVNTVTIDPNLSETIDSAATFPLNIQKRGIVIVSDGTNWQIKAWYSPKIIASEIDAEASTDGQILTSDGAGNVAFEDPALSPKGLVQVVNIHEGDFVKLSGTIPYDDTIPKNTEGLEVMSAVITPTNASNRLKIDIVTFVSSDDATPPSNRVGITALFQDSIVDALSSGINPSTYNGGRPTPCSFSYVMTAGTTSPITFKVRCGLNTTVPPNDTGALNGGSGIGGARILGGSLASSLTISEISV
jgi:hypothetical protein